MSSATLNNEAVQRAIALFAPASGETLATESVCEPVAPGLQLTSRGFSTLTLLTAGPLYEVRWRSE